MFSRVCLTVTRPKASGNVEFVGGLNVPRSTSANVCVVCALNKCLFICAGSASKQQCGQHICKHMAFIQTEATIKPSAAFFHFAIVQNSNNDWEQR